MPTEYAIDALAQRWGVHPREIENDPDPTWFIRGTTYLRLEAEAARKRK